MGPGRPQQQVPGEGGAALGQQHLQPGIPAQQAHHPLAGQHGGLGLAREQQAEAVTVVVGQGGAPQPPQALRVLPGQGDRHPGGGGQHQPAGQAGVEQQVPALGPAPGQVGPAAQHQHPGAVGPGEGQGAGAGGPWSRASGAAIGVSRSIRAGVPMGCRSAGLSSAAQPSLSCSRPVRGAVARASTWAGSSRSWLRQGLGRRRAQAGGRSPRLASSSGSWRSQPASRVRAEAAPRRSRVRRLRGGVGGGGKGAPIQRTVGGGGPRSVTQA
jgi:hypothetical protein